MIIAKSFNSLVVTRYGILILAIYFHLLAEITSVKRRYSHWLFANSEAQVFGGKFVFFTSSQNNKLVT